jgi:hypothetical protein
MDCTAKLAKPLGTSASAVGPSGVLFLLEWAGTGDVGRHFVVGDARPALFLLDVGRFKTLGVALCKTSEKRTTSLQVYHHRHRAAWGSNPPAP